MQQQAYTRSERREAVLRTIFEEGPESAAYIAYVVACPATTVTADLRWLESEGFVRSERAPGGYINGLGRRASVLWNLTEQGKAYALGVDRV